MTINLLNNWRVPWIYAVCFIKFAYRHFTHPVATSRSSGVQPFALALAVLTMLLITMGTIGYLVRQALHANPAEVLRLD